MFVVGEHISAAQPLYCTAMLTCSHTRAGLCHLTDEYTPYCTAHTSLLLVESISSGLICLTFWIAGDFIAEQQGGGGGGGGGNERCGKHESLSTDYSLLIVFICHVLLVLCLFVSVDAYGRAGVALHVWTYLKMNTKYLMRFDACTP